jgi:hypothetical protein
MSASVPTVAQASRVAAAVLTEWKPISPPRGTLLGYASVRFAGGWIVSAIPIFNRDGGGLSAGVPRQPQIGADGKVRVGEDGKQQWKSIISFDSGDARRRWDQSVLGALAAGGITGVPELTS